MFKVENLTKLRLEMAKRGLKAYLIMTGDYHASEYAASYFLSERMYFCPFTGSAGQLLVTLTGAYLFTDGRYWIQAENELENSTIKVIRAGDKNVPSFEEFISQNKLYPLGLNLYMISENEHRYFKKLGVEIINTDFSYLVENRPLLSKEKVFKIDEKLFSKTYKEKIEEIETEIEKQGGQANLVTSLDDIAWILNIRGKDIPCNPVFYSYLYISKEYGTHLFIDKDKIDFSIDGVSIHPYSEILNFVKAHSEIPTLLDPSKVSAILYSSFKNPIDASNPSYLMKAIKGSVEIENIKRIQAIDGLALLKFQKYLEENISNNLTEYDYSEVLRKFRFESKDIFDLSFDTIAACGSNAAQMHYEPTKEKSSVVSSDQMELLVDSGGQYFGGTTDTTRTFLIGKPSKEYIHDYTLTLKALINLSKTIFLDGSTGQTIDIRAREFMWEEGMDYKCGTGHGVSYMLNVHEGPNGFRYRKVADRDDQAKIVPGMITTIEPGVYKQDKYGIRIENNLLCTKAFETDMGVFYKFETITYVPITIESLDLDMMDQKEIDWLNSYHQLVYSKLSPLIKDEELLAYLVKKTQKIVK